jgi:hypothetical protein
MSISKNALVTQLKDDASFNGYKLDGNFLVFDNTADLTYIVLPGYPLGSFLTHNPVASYTRISMDLIVRLSKILDNLAVSDYPNINSSYRSPEYNKTVLGASPNSLHCLGLALDLGGNPDTLNVAITGANLGGELGIYNWGCHTAIRSDAVTWDKRTDLSVPRKVKDFLAPDTKRNYAYGIILALVGFFIIKRIF